MLSPSGEPFDKYFLDVLKPDPAKRGHILIPADLPQRARILVGYRLMMAALLKYQTTDGVWRQLIDHDEMKAETRQRRFLDSAYNQFSPN